MKVYNTMTRSKEELVTRNPGEVRIYTCGPTVYSFIHIGNARALVTFDILHRYLLARGFDVVYVQNFTDIDDKMIRAAKVANTSVKELADKYIAEYNTDAAGLNLLEPDHAPRATETMDTILELIGTLISKGHAYQADDGVYFSVRSWPAYGKLSGYDLDDLQNEVREDLRSTEGKRDPLDFVLWKNKRDDEPSWESPWGEGRPGWHIECSAMVHRYLDDVIDIHAGGLDLIFPHHENEIAQSEAASGEPFAKYWMHNGFVNIDHQKMSKSVGNFRTVREIAEHYSYNTMRYLLASSHYRSPMNFSEELLQSSEASLQRIQTAVNRLRFLLSDTDYDLSTKSTVLPAAASSEVQETLKSFLDDYHEAMDDDLNTADALGTIFDLVRYTNRELDPAADQANGNSNGDEKPIAPEDQIAALSLIVYMTDILGIQLNDEDAVPAEILEMVAQRTAAKAERDFAKADSLRDRIAEAGYEVRDTPQGSQVERLKQ